MKRLSGFALLAIQAAAMVFVMLMFWSQPPSNGDPYAQFAAFIVGVPIVLVSGLSLCAIYALRAAFSDQYRDKLLLMSAAMLVGTIMAVTSGFFGLSPR